MLKKVDTITIDPAAYPPRVSRYSSIITIAEARHCPIEVRADLAAHYLGGLLTVKPTAVLARYVFHASLVKIKAALRQLDSSQLDTFDDDAESELEAAWSNATSEERTVFIKNHGSQLLRAIDHLTCP